MGFGWEFEFGMVFSGMKGDVNLNVNMGFNFQMIFQKMREVGVGFEEMLKLCLGGLDMLFVQQKMVLLLFGEYFQQEYGMGFRLFFFMFQGLGSNSGLWNFRELIGFD